MEVFWNEIYLEIELLGIKWNIFLKIEAYCSDLKFWSGIYVEKSILKWKLCVTSIKKWNLCGKKYLEV